MQKEFHFNIHAVMADGIYETASMLDYIINELKARPRIARNPRNTKDPPERRFSKAGNPFCNAQLEMLARGTFYDKVQNRWRRKWVCPIRHSKKTARKFLICPVFHPNSSLQRDVIHISVSMMISAVKSTMALSPSKRISICELDLSGSSQDCSASVCKIPLLLVLRQQPTMLP